MGSQPGGVCKPQCCENATTHEVKFEDAAQRLRALHTTDSSGARESQNTQKLDEASRRPEFNIQFEAAAATSCEVEEDEKKKNEEDENNEVTYETERDKIMRGLQEADQKTKQHLQEAVKAFAKSAVAGMDCRIVLDGAHVPARLKLDRKLRVLKIDAACVHNEGAKTWEINLSDVKDVCKYETARTVLPNILQDCGLRVEQRDWDRVVVIFWVKDHRQSGVCLFQNHRSARDQIVDVLQCLRMNVSDIN